MKLQLKDWKLKGFWPGEPLYSSSIERIVEYCGVTGWMPAPVPGGVHKVLQAAGLIPDPYFGMNSLLCEWVENRWWVYRTEFDTPALDQSVILRFEGLDDHCWIYLNDRRIAEHSGIFEPVECEVTDSLSPEGRNCLMVVFDQPAREQDYFGWTSKTHTQKARFGYKWDFSTHLVNIGIWQAVWMETVQAGRLKSVYVSTDIRDREGVIRVQAEVDGFAERAEITISLGGQEVCCQRVSFPRHHNPRLDAAIRLEEPALWYPNGQGDQPLYEVRVALNDLDDPWVGLAGIRSLRFRRCDGASNTAFPYQPVINGQPVYIRGVNMTPLDHRYGDVTPEAYRMMMLKMKHMNVNAVRVHGAGIIETEEFYRLADEMGILVWQEFNQSSSGIENQPSHDPTFLALLERNARAALESRRNHTALTWWSGGNELMDMQRHPITEGDVNIHMLKTLTEELDPQRLFLPSSPSGPSVGLDSPLEHHDVHGNWKYDGIRAHYEKYNREHCMLHSEFGADGMSSVEQICRILPEADFCVDKMQNHPAMRHHGEWWETLQYRDEPLFGPIAPLDHPMEAWTAVSQLMQAEALRYIVTSNRRNRGGNCGGFIWQMNEPFPNMSCTSLVEYYGAVKAAWYAVRRAYANEIVSLHYDSLIQPPEQPSHMRAHVDALSGAENADLRVVATDLHGQIFFEQRFDLTLSDGRTDVGWEMTLPALDEGVFLVRLDCRIGTRKLREEYFFAQREEMPLRPLVTAPAPRLSAWRDGDGIALQNTGDVTALFVMGTSPDAPDALLSDNGIVLWPGEQTWLKILSASPGMWRFTDLAGRVLAEC